MLSGKHVRAMGDKGKLRPALPDRILARARRPLDRAFERRALDIESLAALSAGSRPASKAESRPEAQPAVKTESRLASSAESRLASSAGSRPHRARDPGRSEADPPKVLVASLRGWVAHNAYELVIAQALRIRGAEVALLTCGGGLPACELGWSAQAYPRPCDRCGYLTDRLGEIAGLPHYRLGSLLPWGEDPRMAPSLPADENSLAARDDAVANVRWLLRATELDRVPDARELVEDFAVAAGGVERAAEAVLDEFAPDVILLLNGLFGAEKTIRRLALRRGMRAPTYELAPRGGTLVFSQGLPAPDYDVDRLWAAVRDRPLSARQRSQTIGLLEDRARGIGAHESYYDRPEENPEKLRRHLRLSGRERIVSLFTNVTWDTATIDHDIGFASMFDWVEQAVRFAAGRELTLVVRIHPAEARWGTREHAQAVISSRIGELPPNVRFVSAQDALSSYTLLDLSDLLLTYATTVGLEAAARGKQVAVSGDTHYRGRGFTIDISKPEELARVMGLEPARLPPTDVELATRYAHMFFFRAMIPFPAVEVQDGKVKGLPRRAEALAPGVDPYLDWICERIFDGQDFGLPDELAGALT